MNVCVCEFELVSVVQCLHCISIFYCLLTIANHPIPTPWPLFALHSLVRSVVRLSVVMLFAADVVKFYLAHFSLSSLANFTFVVSENKYTKWWIQRP